MIDTNVLIEAERTQAAINLSGCEPSEAVYVSVVTVSELLVGVHRADTEERRNRRSAFVEAIISGVSVLEFTVPVARLHAELFADLSAKGKMIGAHDLLIAATARFHDLSVLTDNVDEFSRVAGLRVIPFVS
jgi:predicted nucleic acid-binding protein